MSHFKKVCIECGKVVSQCRCPSTNKQIIDVVCDECKLKNTPKKTGVELITAERKKPV